MRIFVHGTGSIGMRHLGILRRMPGVRPIAVPVRAERVPTLRAAGFEVMAEDSVHEAGPTDLAIVCTDTSRHAVDANRWLACERVLVEKPLAIDGERARAVVQSAGDTGTPLFVAYPLRFHRTLRAAAALVPRLGHITSIRAECQSYLPDWRPGRDYRSSYSARIGEGGVLRDLSHEIDYLLHLFGHPPEVTACIAPPVLDIEAEDAADLLWVTPRGAVASLRVDYVTRTARRRLVVCGDAGVVEADLLGGTLSAVIGGEKLEERPESDDMYRAQLTAFVNEAGAGLATAEDGVAVMAVADAARRSASSGCTARIT